MSRRRRVTPHTETPGTPEPALSPSRRRLFVALTLAAPFIFFAAFELVLRLAWPAGSLPAFERLSSPGEELLVPSRRLARRYFSSQALPPVPPLDAFAARKPANGFRVFVLGESTAAGFPYPHHGSFSLVIRDALQDLLPRDSVEVINLGIAATNSFTMVDLVDDVLGQRPDAVLIYAGHNEYYGALGTGSSIRIGSSPRFVRAYLAAEHLRSVLLLRIGLARLQQALRPTQVTDSTVATLMESVARDQQIDLDGRAYRAGLAQFGDNLGIVLERFRFAGVPVFVASVASNERDQPPFASAANGNAVATYDSARLADARHDSASARRLFARARDLDVIRFRAPSALNDTIRTRAAASGAHYVPVAERFAAASAGGVPGNELFLEHVHPTQHGYVLIAAAFVDAIRGAQFLGRAAQPGRLAPWRAYEARMALTPFDERVVHHMIRTVTTRWPFVTRANSVDYRGTYSPVDFQDSLALLVSRGGMSWGEAKARVAAAAESQAHPESALGEYMGLLRDKPYVEAAYRAVGRTMIAAGRDSDAVPYLERALARGAHAESCYLLGVVAIRQKDYPRAIALLDRAVTLAPTTVAPLYQLSVAFGLSHNLMPARAAAQRAAQMDPSYPGLASWMTVLGMTHR